MNEFRSQLRDLVPRVAIHSLVFFVFYFIKNYNDIKSIDNESDKDKLQEQSKITFERNIAASLLKIRETANTYFQTKEPNLKSQRRQSLNDQDKYLKLCQQSIKLNEESNNCAIEQVLKNFYTKDQFYNILQSIPPKTLQQYFLELFHPTENEKKIELNTLKEAKLYLYNITINLHKELIAELKTFENISEEEFNKRKGIFLFLNHMKVNDMLYMKYGIEEDRLELLCLKNRLIDDREINEAEEELKKLDKVI